jgi:hypothetical protein
MKMACYVVLRLNRRGVAVFTEYFVIATILAIAAVVFFTNHLKTEGTGARGSLEQAVDAHINLMLQPANQNRMGMTNTKWD